MIIISSDSTSDLGKLYAERDVKVMPLSVVLGGQAFVDGETVTPSDIYAFVDKTGALPKTAARSVEEYKEFFLKYKADGVKHIHFTISSELSVTNTNARAAAEEVGDVIVIDGRSLSTGTGLLILYACDLRDSGKYTAEEIADMVNARVSSVQASFYVEKMDYLHKGGRCSGLVKLFASAFKIKPCLLLKGGKILVGQKFRGKTHKIAVEYVNSIFDQFNTPDLKRVFVTHTAADPEVLELIKAEVKKRASFVEMYDTEASCTVTCHCGKGTIGVLYMNDGDKVEK